MAPSSSSKASVSNCWLLLLEITTALSLSHHPCMHCHSLFSQLDLRYLLSFRAPVTFDFVAKQLLGMMLPQLAQLALETPPPRLTPSQRPLALCSSTFLLAPCWVTPPPSP